MGGRGGEAGTALFLMGLRCVLYPAWDLGVYDVET